MAQKTYISDSGAPPASQIGATLDALAATISARAASGDEESYTRLLLDGPLDRILKKIDEEALEVALAAKECQMLGSYASGEEVDASIDHMRYEAADVIYHLLVLMQRFDIPIDELAAELNCRMREDELPSGCVMLFPVHVRRGK